MRIFSVYSPPIIQDYVEDIKYIEETFSIRAMLFNVVWLLYNRLFFQGIIATLLIIMLAILVKISALTFSSACHIYICYAIYLGLNAHNWVELIIMKNGYIYKDIILAKNLDEAKEKFLNRALQQQIQDN